MKQRGIIITSSRNSTQQLEPGRGPRSPVQNPGEAGHTGLQAPWGGRRLWTVLPATTLALGSASQASGSGERPVARPAALCLLPGEPSGTHKSRGQAVSPLREGATAPVFPALGSSRSGLPSLQLSSQLSRRGLAAGRGSRNSPCRQPVCGRWPTEGHSVPGHRQHPHCTGREEGGSERSVFFP